MSCVGGCDRVYDGLRGLHINQRAIRIVPRRWALFRFRKQQGFLNGLRRLRLNAPWPAGLRQAQSRQTDDDCNYREKLLEISIDHKNFPAERVYLRLSGVQQNGMFSDAVHTRLVRLTSM